jgi:hypothetical protein
VKFPDKAATLVIFGGVVNDVIEKGRLGKVVNEVRPDKSTTRNPVDPDKSRLVNRGKLPKPVKLVNDRGVVNDVREVGSAGKDVNSVRPDKFKDVNPVRPDKFMLVNPVDPDKSRLVNRGKPVKLGIDVILGGVFNVVKDGGSPDKDVICAEGDKSRLVNRFKAVKLGKLVNLGGVVNDVREVGNAGKDVNPVRPDKFALVNPVEPVASMFANRGKPVKDPGIPVNPGGVVNDTKDGGSSGMAVIKREGSKFNVVKFGGGPLSSLKFAVVVRETGPIFPSNDKSGSVGGIVHEGFVSLNRTIS